MQISLVVIKHEKMAAIPAADRNVLLLFGHVLNELTMLLRIAMLSMQSIHEESGDLARASEGQAFFLMRLLGGKTQEAWEVFKTRFDGNEEIAKKYGKALALKCDRS